MKKYLDGKRLYGKARGMKKRRGRCETSCGNRYTILGDFLNHTPRCGLAGSAHYQTTECGSIEGGGPYDTKGELRTATARELPHRTGKNRLYNKIKEKTQIAANNRTYMRTGRWEPRGCATPLQDTLRAPGTSVAGIWWGLPRSL